MDNKNFHHIVIAEDQAIQRHVLRCQVNSLGYNHIHEADSGVDALKLCQEYNVDLLFCDLRMPGVDGIALLRQLSIIEFRGAVIIASAQNDDVINSVLRMGVASGLRILGALKKPININQIEKLLATQPPPLPPEKNRDVPAISLSEFQQALDMRIIEPWYQPKIDFRTGEWVGAEALARWYHPERGFISPSIFIPLAEQHGLIEKLTDVIFSKSMQAARLWAQSGLSINLSLNVSTQSLVRSGLDNRILGLCRYWGVDPSLITLEITESAFIEDLVHSLEILSRLRMNGFGLSIDDFGTGYSSVQLITILPFTELKLDHSFVSHCCNDTSHMAVVEYSLKLAKRLGIKSVAEGVEDELTWHTLAHLGFDMCQGYFSAKPMPAKELNAWHQMWKKKANNILKNITVTQ